MAASLSIFTLSVPRHSGLVLGPNAMAILAALLIAPLVAGCLTDLLCRLSRRRNRRPPWLIVPFAVAMGVIATWAVMFQTDLFHPSRWSSKLEGDDLFALALPGVPAAAWAAAVAVLILCLHYAKYARTHPRP
jgi:MFS family permease